MAVVGWGDPSTERAGRMPELLMVSLCHGVWLCRAGQSCLTAPGTLLSWGGGIWGTLRVGGVHGDVKMAEWVHIAGAGCRWVGRCTPVGAGGKLTHPDGGSPGRSGHSSVHSPSEGQGQGSSTSTATGMGHAGPEWGQRWAGAQLCAWHCCPGSGTPRERGARPVALKGTRREPGRDGNEPPGVRTAQRRPLGWAETFPAPRHNVCKYQRPLMAGRQWGGRGALPASPLNGGSSSSAVPHGCPVAPQMVGRGGQRLPIAFVGVSALEPGEQGVSGRNVPAQCPPCWG